jgi:hypothetical protein
VVVLFAFQFVVPLFFCFPFPPVVVCFVQSDSRVSLSCASSYEELAGGREKDERSDVENKPIDMKGKAMKSAFLRSSSSDKPPPRAFSHPFLPSQSLSTKERTKKTRLCAFSPPFLPSSPAHPTVHSAGPASAFFFCEFIYAPSFSSAPFKQSLENNEGKEKTTHPIPLPRQPTQLFQRFIGDVPALFEHLQLVSVPCFDGERGMREGNGQRQYDPSSR